MMYKGKVFKIAVFSACGPCVLDQYFRVQQVLSADVEVLPVFCPEPPVIIFLRALQFLVYRGDQLRYGLPNRGRFRGRPINITESVPKSVKGCKAMTVSR